MRRKGDAKGVKRVKLEGEGLTRGGPRGNDRRGKRMGTGK